MCIALRLREHDFKSLNTECLLSCGIQAAAAFLSSFSMGSVCIIVSLANFFRFDQGQPFGQTLSLAKCVGRKSSYNHQSQLRRPRSSRLTTI